MQNSTEAALRNQDLVSRYYEKGSEDGGLIKGLSKGYSLTGNPVLPKHRQIQAGGIYLQQKQLTLPSEIKQPAR